MTKILPVHIVYNDRKLDEDLNAELMQFSARLFSQSTYIRISGIRMGTFLDPMLSPREFQQSQATLKSRESSETKQFRIDFSGTLSRILEDYKKLNKIYSAEIYHPEILILITKGQIPEPVSEWSLYWGDLVNTYGANIQVEYWLSQGLIAEKNYFESIFPQGVKLHVENNTKISVKDFLKSAFSSTSLQYRVNSKLKEITSAPLPSPTPVSHLKSDKNKLSTAGAQRGNAGGINNDQSAKSPSESTQQSSATPNQPPTEIPEEAKGDSHPTPNSGKPVAESGENKEPSKPILVKPAQPAVWLVQEPPPELTDRFNHTYTDDRVGPKGWNIYGASRRGKLHEHEATFREDAMAIDEVDGWLLVAVADGAGSHYLSRVGSNLAVQTCISKMIEVVKDPDGGIPNKFVVKAALEKALQGAWQALYDEYQKRNIEFKDLSTTLLLLMYYPAKNLVGVAQVGDGLIAAQLDDDGIALLGNPESGEYSGQTYFITNHKKEELGSKVYVYVPSSTARYFFVMTDGVADDIYPPQDHLPALIKVMPGIIKDENPSKALLEFLKYPRPGSFDDRTLVVACQKDKIMALPESAGQISESRPQNEPSEKSVAKEPQSEAQPEAKPKAQPLPDKPSPDNDTPSVQADDASNLTGPSTSQDKV